MLRSLIICATLFAACTSAIKCFNDTKLSDKPHKSPPLVDCSDVSCDHTDKHLKDKCFYVQWLTNSTLKVSDLTNLTSHGCGCDVKDTDYQFEAKFTGCYTVKFLQPVTDGKKKTVVWNSVTSCICDFDNCNLDATFATEKDANDMKKIHTDEPVTMRHYGAKGRKKAKKAGQSDEGGEDNAASSPTAVSAVILFAIITLQNN